MKSTLIKDTTKEERIALIREWGGVMFRNVTSETGGSID